jgi:hypothetical protein
MNQTNDTQDISASKASHRGDCKAKGNYKQDESSSSSSDHPQVQVRNTLDADLVLRKCIEDRATIISLLRQDDVKEKELIKAKVFQMQAAQALASIEKDISKQTAKVKYDIKEYNEQSREYIRGFISAFDEGDLELLQHHPVLPSLSGLQESIARCKTAHIEKAQAGETVDDVSLFLIHR